MILNANILIESDKTFCIYTQFDNIIIHEAEIRSCFLLFNVFIFSIAYFAVEFPNAILLSPKRLRDYAHVVYDSLDSHAPRSILNIFWNLIDSTKCLSMYMCSMCSEN